MSKPTIYVAIPTFSLMDVACRQSLDVAARTCQTAVIEVHYAVGDSMISRVRNNQISEFMGESTAEWYMTIDSDLMLKNITASDNIFDKMLSHNEEVMGGLYAKKVVGSNFRCASIPMDDKMPEYDTGIIEMQWLSTGCMLVNRTAIKTMIEAEPTCMYHGDGEFLYKPRYGLYMPGIAEIERDGKVFLKYLSEDWAFCLRLHKVGIPIYADTSILLTHWGTFGFKLWDV